MRFFAKKSTSPILVDIHSHLIPNIDDGAQSLDHSLDMIKEMVKLGYKKLITTPHIHPRYPNTPEIIMSGLGKLQTELDRNKIEIEIEAAAEYFVDESFHQKILDGLPILSFGDRYVLVESSFTNKPLFFESVLFDLKSKGYNPILAHPERYAFLEGSIEWIQELDAMGVLLQVTLGSIGGYYGENPQKMAKKLLKHDLVHFLGSDLHHQRHIPFLAKGLKSKEAQQMISSNKLKNHLLL